MQGALVSVYMVDIGYVRRFCEERERRALAGSNVALLRGEGGGCGSVSCCFPLCLDMYVRLDMYVLPWKGSEAKR